MAPVLPPELWEHIIRAVASEPVASSPPLHAVHLGYYANDLGQRRARRALRNKCALALVCWSWNALVEPYLFDHIILQRVERLDPLIGLLKENRVNKAPRGSYVRRLDLLAPSPYSPASMEEKDLLSSMGELLSLLPNLDTLVFRSSLKGGPGRIMPHSEHSFLLSATPNLRSFFWVDEADNWALVKTAGPIWDEFLTTHPNLRAVHRPQLEYSDHWWWAAQEGERCLTSPLSVTSQTTHTILRIEFHDISDALALPVSYADGGESSGDDCYPNLRSVLFKFPVIGPYAMEMLGEVVPVPTMLQVHGSKLTSVHCVYHKVLLEDSPQLQLLTAIAQSCPNLQELGLFFNWRWRERESETEWDVILPCQFPQVKTLKVRRLERHFELVAYRQMLGFVARTVGGEARTLPNCEVVEFVEERDHIYFRRFKELLHGRLIALKDCPVRLVDWKGEDMALQDVFV